MKILVEVFGAATTHIVETVDASAMRATAAIPTANASGQEVGISRFHSCLFHEILPFTYLRLATFIMLMSQARVIIINYSKLGKRITQICSHEYYA